MTNDVIDALAGIQPGSALDRIREGRAQARREAQASYRALFEPAQPDAMSLEERFAVASFVAGLHEQPEIASFYAAKLGPGLRDTIAQAVAEAKGQGPYGRYPPGPLSREDAPGPRYRISAGFSRRLGAALEHAHMLVFHPRDAAPEALQELVAAGWSADGIVTLSQLVAFLSFQIRAVAGLRALAAHM
ncbi:MAG TPA: CMD domain protein [Acetobacteraceae bacterium]|nr:CMD domain protein [Acetobacteraceae bacterium]